MRLGNFNLDWLSRLGKVAFVFIAIFTIWASYIAVEENFYNGPKSSIFLYSALCVAVTYLVLIVATKILLYVVKGDDFIKSGLHKRHYLLLLLPVVIFLVTGVIFLSVVEPAEKREEERIAKIKYDDAISKIDGLRKSFKMCIEPAVESEYKSKLRSCNLQKDTMKNKYNVCKTTYVFESPASCLYQYDYESIDCDEDTVRLQASFSVAIDNVPFYCQSYSTQIKELNSTITKYESENKKR